MSVELIVPPRLAAFRAWCKAHKVPPPVYLPPTVHDWLHEFEDAPSPSNARPDY